MVDDPRVFRHVGLFVRCLRLTDVAGSVMGCTLIERWRCFWHGHRDLSRTPSYAATLADGRTRELHFCMACDSLVWADRQPTKMETQLTWKNVRI